MQAQTRRYALVLTLFAIAAKVPAADAALTDRQERHDCFLQNRAASPPRAYICAYGYVAKYGLDQQGLEMQRWIKAYSHLAPPIYHDTGKFGVAYGNLDVFRGSLLWALRNDTIDWLLGPSPDTFYSVYRPPNGTVTWWALGPALTPRNITELPSVAIWATPRLDWQAIGPQGTALNTQSGKPDLIQVIQPVAGHKPTRLFASPSGGWVVVWDDIKKIQCSSDVQFVCDWATTSVFPAGFVPRDVTIGNNGVWAGIYGVNGSFWSKGCPTGLAGAIESAHSAGQYIESIGIFPTGGWYLKVNVRAH